MEIDRKSTGYLSGAPRVSSSLDSEAGGPRSHVLGVIQAFENLGWEVYPYIVGNRVPRILQTKSRKTMESSWWVRFASDFVRLFLGLFHSWKSWIELHDKVDWVYERFAVLQALGWIFQNKKRPWILETSGLYYYEASIERKSIVLIKIARIIEKWAYRHCDVLICVTEALKELVITELGVPAEKILVVPNGVDCIRFNPLDRNPIRIFTGPTIGFVSTLIRWHRLDILLDALAELKDEGLIFNLTVLGDGPMRQSWETQAINLGLKQTTVFLGQIPWDKVPDYMAGFDLGFVGNDVMEIGVMYHSPLKLYEYMAMGLPVISTEFIDSNEMLSSSKCGYLFKAGDKEDLKKSLRLAHFEQEEWENIGVNARQLIITKASWTSRVKTMISGIEQILSVNKYGSLKFRTKK